MRITKFLAASALTVLLAACGAGSDSSPQFASLVSFGDSLSDVGTYKVGAIEKAGGGKWTINAPGNKIWVEEMASRLNLPAPCAAETGLTGDPTKDFSVLPTKHDKCTAYGQGGSRVTNPVGPGNAKIGDPVGALTVPVITQMNNHLAASGGAYKGNEVVLVLAGGNDVFMNLAAISGGATPTQAVTEMGKAGAELAGYVKAFVLAKGAQYVAVVNLPDVSKTPYAYGLKNADGTPNTALQGLISTMSSTFNTQLKKGLDGTNVIYVDAYTVGRDQAANPGNYGIVNNKDQACLVSSLVCTPASIIAGDVSKYQFADGVHLTPFGYRLIADSVTSEMAKKGWIK
jgi:phospholipase/lecithinase/hemolysin